VEPVIAPVLAAFIGLGSTLAAPSTTGLASARSELRLRSSQAGGAQTASAAPAFDVDTTGTAGLSFDWRPTRFSFVYSPRFVVNDIGGPEAARDFLQALDLLLTLQSRKYTLTLTNHVEYGYRRFTALDAAQLDPITQRPIVGVTPGPNSVQYAATFVQVALNAPLTRRSDLQLTARYGLNGGVDEESRRTLPLLVGPRLDALWTYALTHRDTTGVAVSGTWTRSLGAVQTGPGQTGAVNSGALTIGQRWDRTWRRELRTSLLVGVGLLYRPGHELRPLPQGFATLTRAFPGGANHGALELSLAAGTSIDADPLTGTTRPNVRGTGQVAWTAYPFRAYVLGGALKTLESAGATTAGNAATVYMADTGVSYAVLRPLLLELGVRLTDQQVDAPSTASAVAAANGFTYAAFFAVAWRPQLHTF
jgi:hypothetical protein